MVDEVTGEDNTGEEVSPEGTTALTAEPVQDGSGDNVNASGDVGKTDEDTDPKAEEKGEDGAADKLKDEAPDTYKDFSVPEGIEIDPKVLEEFQGTAKDLNLSQDQAQKLIDMQSKLAEVSKAKAEAAWADQQSKWREAAQNDEEYGKGKYDESVSIARSAMFEIGGAPLAKALEETGMGNHPEFIRFMYRVGKATRDDNFNFGKGSASAPKSHADVLYPDQGR